MLRSPAAFARAARRVRYARAKSTRIEGDAAPAAAVQLSHAQPDAASRPSHSNGPPPPRPETPLTLAEAVYGHALPAPADAQWANRDNERHEDGRYAKFVEAVKTQTAVDPKRVYTDAARTFAYGTDASFYRLIPKVSVRRCRAQTPRTPRPGRARCHTFSNVERILCIHSNVGRLQPITPPSGLALARADPATRHRRARARRAAAAVTVAAAAAAAADRPHRPSLRSRRRRR